MAIEIDQSGKIEDTGKDTVIAYSNGKQYAVIIPKKVKRQVQEIFRLGGMNRLYIYFLFSYGLYRLLLKLDKMQGVTVDREYSGKEKLITEFVQLFFKRDKKKGANFKFGNIGNHPRAHYAAKDVLDRKLEPDEKIILSDVLKAIKIADGHLRGCLSTLVDARSRLSKKSISKKPYIIKYEEEKAGK